VIERAAAVCGSRCSQYDHRRQRGEQPETRAQRNLPVVVKPQASMADAAQS
jgi:hypothetical protein